MKISLKYNRTIVTAVTAEYTNYLATFLHSILANLKSEYSIVIIYKDLNSTTIREFLENNNSNIDIHFISISDIPERIILEEFVDSPTYWRVIAPYIVKSDRLVYLDLDTLVLEDFPELFTWDLARATAAACIDYLPEVKDGVSNWESLGLQPNHPYFNAGMILIDTQKWLKKDISNKVIQIVQQNGANLLAKGKWPQNDQYGLNIALINDWVALPNTYNYGSGLEYKPCKILHFIGAGKPGMRRCRSEFTEIFIRYS